MKVMLLGYGTMGRIHLESYGQLKDVEVVGVYTTSEVDGGIPTFTDLEDCFGVDFDILDVCLPTHLHKAAFLKGLDHGKHIFLEKPVAHNLSDAADMLERAKASDRKVMVGQTLRYLPEYQRLKECIDRDKPVSVQCSRRSKLPRGKNNWFLDRSKSGGVILDLSLHDIDFVRWAFGSVKTVYAQATPNHDYALITLHHENGSISRCEASWLYNGGFTMEVELAQEGQLYAYNNQAATPVHLFRSIDAPKQTVEVPTHFFREDPFYQELSAFIQAIREDTEVPVSLEDAYESTRLALLAVQSASERRPITVSG